MHFATQGYKNIFIFCRDAKPSLTPRVTLLQTCETFTHDLSKRFASVKCLTHALSERFASVKWLTHGQSERFAIFFA